MQQVYIYNSKSRKKELFVPIHTNQVLMYVCGPTVYGHSHLGHAKSYISFDCIVRWFRYLGYKVTYVQNITDVGHLTDNADDGEDKVQKKAIEDNIHPMEIAQFYTKSYFEDMDALCVLRPNISPTATGHIPEQIAIIEELIAKNFAYVVDGNVYFEVSKFPDYGKLSGRINQDELQSGTRVEKREDKKHPSDFALWKKAEPNHIMKWYSSWSIGYPGWHIECSAMSMKYLGEHFDVHGGGLENKFPHHECEIAQSEAYTGKSFANYWVHNNMVTVNGQKMGKSLGNFTTIKELLTRHHALSIRFFILQSHYRSTLDFSDDAIGASNEGRKKLLATMQTIETHLQQHHFGKNEFTLQKYEDDFVNAMNDDFNTPMAIAVLFTLIKEVNANFSANELSKASLEKILLFLNTFAIEVLAIISKDELQETTTTNKNFDGLMEIVSDVRKKLREKKEYALSDFIRDELKSKLGYEAKDL